MNIRESNDLNTVLHYLLGDTVTRTGGVPVTSERVIEAAERLAERATKTLMAGLTGAQVRERWPATSPAEDRAALARVREYIGGELTFTNAEMSTLADCCDDHYEECAAVWRGYFLRVARAALDGADVPGC